MFSSRKSKLNQAISRGALIGIVIVIVIIIAVGGYLAITSLTSKTTTTCTGTACTTTSSSTPGPSPPNTNQLTDDTPGSAFDSLDPGYGFFVTDGYFANVFQSLVTYKTNSTGVNSLQVAPAVASSYTASPNYENYSFTIRPNVWFSNKDPVNAYVAWFSFVRELYYNAPTTVGSSNFVGLTFNSSSVGHDATVWPWGLQNALVANGVPANENAEVAAMNQMLSNFNPSNATQVAIMSYAHQAYVASASMTFLINLIQPYSLFLLDLPPQWGAVQDPIYIDAHGGVVNNTNSAETSYFNTHGMPGTGPYEYGPNAATSGQSQLVLDANPSYWAANVTGLDPSLQPAHIAQITMNFGEQPNTQIADFDSNTAQLAMGGAENGNVGPAQFQAAYDGYKYKSAVNFSAVFTNFGVPLCDLPLAQMNTQIFPTNMTGLREAIVHAVNYTQMETQFIFNGTQLGLMFAPPIPPGYGALDNPQNIPLYSYNITLARQVLNKTLASTSYYAIDSAGQTLGNPSGTQLPPIALYYLAPLTPVLQEEITVMQQGLTQIGIALAPQATTEGYYGSFIDTTPQNGVPMVDVGWCADWPDPIYQQFYDLATQAAHENSWLTNTTLDNLLSKIPFETNSTLQIQQTEQAYNIYLSLNTMVQAPEPDNYIWHAPYISGLVYSPFQYAILYNLITYT